MDDGSRERTLWVGNLGPEVTADLLTELFLQSGPLECPVKVVAGKDGKNGYGFVTFKHEESVLYACRLLRSQRLCGSELLIKPRQGSNHEREWQEILPAERVADRERARQADRETRNSNNWQHQQRHQHHQRQLPQPPMPPPPPPNFPLSLLPPPPQQHQRHQQQQHQELGNFRLPLPPPMPLLPPPVGHHQQHRQQHHQQHHQQHRQQHHQQQHQQQQYQQSQSRHHPQHHHQGIKRSTSDSGFHHHGRNKQPRF